MMMRYVLQTEKIPYTQMLTHLQETVQDFASHAYMDLREYAAKLSGSANFVSARDADGKLIGVIAYYANNERFAYISHVWVSNCYRGGGICGKMLSRIEESCNGKGLPIIRLEVRSDNTSAIKAYRKFGFALVSYDGFKAVMEKRIS